MDVKVTNVAQRQPRPEWLSRLRKTDPRIRLDWNPCAEVWEFLVRNEKGSYSIIFSLKDEYMGGSLPERLLRLSHQAEQRGTRATILSDEDGNFVRAFETEEQFQSYLESQHAAKEDRIRTICHDAVDSTLGRVLKHGGRPTRVLRRIWTP